MIGEWATRRRRAEQAKSEQLQRVPSARILARWLTTGRDRLTKVETLIALRSSTGVPTLVEAREAVGAFQTMVRAMAPDRLEAWIARAGPGLVAAFARGVGQDRGCGSGRDHVAMVERPDRGADHDTQARAALDVRARQD